ncbi:MAG: hypothetical protein ACRC8S_21495 [Fimbriiglobus sp.]
MAEQRMSLCTDKYATLRKTAHRLLVVYFCLCAGLAIGYREYVDYLYDINRPRRDAVSAFPHIPVDSDVVLSWQASFDELTRQQKDAIRRFDPWKPRIRSAIFILHLVGMGLSVLTAYHKSLLSLMLLCYSGTLAFLLFIVFPAMH